MDDTSAQQFDDDWRWGRPGPWAPPPANSRVLFPPPPPPGPPAPEPPKRNQRRVIGALVAVALAAAGIVGGVAVEHGLNSSSNQAILAPATTAPPTTSNGSGRRPATTTPSTTPSGGTGSTPSSPSTTTGPGASPQRSDTSQLDVGVVDIDTKLQYQNASAAGTGMILTADGQVLTNNHVVEGATSIKVTVVSTGKTYNAVVLGTDPTDDVALIKMQGVTGLQTVAVGTSTGLNVGDVVTSVGNAQGVGGTPTVASGTITGLDQDITASDPNGANAEQLNGLIETNANMQPGMSGGPLYDNDGKVVGMNTAGSSSGPRRRRGGTPAASGDNYAIPVDHALTIVKQIQSGQETDTVHIGYDGFLGVEVSQDASSTPGAVISQILDGTPAANTNLQAGDVITGIDGTKVTDAASLGTVMDAHKPGDSVKVTWVDTDGKQQTATVTLATAPPD